jgi:hypothetical protein
MSEISKCLKCGGTDLKPGSMASFAGFTFKPAGASIWRDPLNVDAAMCPDCGFLELSADPESLKRVIK